VPVEENAAARRMALVLLAYWCLVMLIALPLPLPAKGALLPIAVGGALPLSAYAARLLWRGSQASGERLANRDELTGIGNRRAFLAQTKLLLRRRKPGMVLLALLDVDGLKGINDDCGHLAGDEMITTISSHLAESHRAVFRIGGDEFAVLIDRSEGETIGPLLEDVQPLLHKFEACGHEHEIGLSFGHATSRAGETLESLFARADARLRQCKRGLYNSGRQRDRRSTRSFEYAFTDDWYYEPARLAAERRQAAGL
jgi:diguanylate cyclase (GGDEF)-like protein